MKEMFIFQNETLAYTLHFPGKWNDNFKAVQRQLKQGDLHLEATSQRSQLNHAQAAL
jgi:hypothetical protein